MEAHLPTFSFGPARDASARDATLSDFFLAKQRRRLSQLTVELTISGNLFQGLAMSCIGDPCNVTRVD